MTGRAFAALACAVIAFAAAVGPWVCGPWGTPAVAPSAAQLLPPGTPIAEARVNGGGFARALDLQRNDTGLRALYTDGWRDIPGVRLDGPVVTRRLWLGSDSQGRDVLARAVAGARTSLEVALVATLAALFAGVGMGLAAALAGPRAAALLAVLTDAPLALPRLLLLLILGVALRGSTWGVALAIGLSSWMEVARLVEAQARAVVALPYVAGVRATGAGPWRLTAMHIVPNLAPVLVVALPLVATQAVLLESTLSFLGVGGDVGAPSWGAMVADAQRLLPNAWWMAVFPGALLVATALAIHGVADRGASDSWKGSLRTERV